MSRQYSYATRKKCQSTRSYWARTFSLPCQEKLYKENEFILGDFSFLNLFCNNVCRIKSMVKYWIPGRSDRNIISMYVYVRFTMLCSDLFSNQKLLLISLVKSNWMLFDMARSWDTGKINKGMWLDGVLTFEITVRNCVTVCYTKFVA